MADLRCDGVARGRTRLRAGAHTIVIHNPGGRSGVVQAHPEWAILVPLAGRIDWSTGQRPAQCAAGLIIPPHVTYHVGSAVGHVSVLVDSWFQGLGRGRHTAVPLDRLTVDHLRFLWSRLDVADIDECARQTVAYLRREGVLPPPVAIDPRVAAALRDLPAAVRIAHLAAGVGLSTSRLRALIHDLTGVPPTRLRMWQRLRAAMVSLADKPIAVAAADAGFADQSHLTRTALRLVGLSPGELARMVPSPRTQRDDDGDQARRAAIVGRS